MVVQTTTEPQAGVKILFLLIKANEWIQIRQSRWIAPTDR
jgi:hypothetical protein